MSSAGRITRWSFLGTLAYRDAVALQDRLRDRLKAGEGEEHLLLLEHPHVYTVGRNAGWEDVRLSAGEAAARGIALAESDRGGQVTYHGPGQLVGWPVIDLRPDRRDVRRYVRDLSAVLIEVLAGYGIAAERRDDPYIGVWVGGQKIASIGVHLSRWCTTHGFALNVSTDLSHFAGIVPCGLPDVSMTSIERLTGSRPALQEVAGRVVAAFAATFDRHLTVVDSEDLKARSVAAAP